MLAAVAACACSLLVCAAGMRAARAADVVVDSSAASAIADSTGLEGLPIRRVEIRTLNIYDPLPPGRLRGVYRLADRLHMRTRTRTVRAQLLFVPGDRWNASRGRETERNLRLLDYLTPSPIRALRHGDSVDVRVETRDAWTTTPEFNLESGGGRVFGSASFTERNFFGLGKSISLSYHNDPTGISRFVEISDPNLLGSWLKVAFIAGNGSAGTLNQLSVGVPFYAEDTPYSYGVSWRRETAQDRLFESNAELADLDERHEETEVHWGRGVREDGWIRRLTASFLVYGRRLGASRLLAPQVPAAFEGGDEDLELRRVAGDLRLWSPHWIERNAVERLDRVEDFDVGPSLDLKLGTSPQFLGASADEAYARVGLDAGADFAPFGFGTLRSFLSSRFRAGPRETIGELDARWVQQPVRGNSLVLAALGISGQRVARDFQVTFGGLTGLRAYPVHALAGNRAWRLNLEDRWRFGHEYFNLLDLGGAVFADAARAWGAGAKGTDWFSDAGLGLRFSLPHSALAQVGRFDVAWPLSPTRDGRRELVISFGSSQAF